MVAGLDEDVGEVTLDDAGFLVAVVVVVEEEAAGFGLVLGELEEVALDRVEVRRAAVLPRVEVLRLFSSSEADGLEDVAVDVRLAAVELAGGRVGGLLSPPPAALVRVELAVGFVAVEEVVAGRRAAVVVVPGAGFLAAVALPGVLGPFAAAGFLTGGAAAAAGAASAAAGAAGGGDWGFSAGASSCWTTSKPSASDILAYSRASFQVQKGRRWWSGLVSIRAANG